MPRKPSSRPSPLAPSRQSPDVSKETTSAHIAAHLAAFAAAGGKVEVLGVTRVLKHVDAVADAPQPARKS